ncbi:mannitol dehydrogenase family protein [Thalassorhabdomicrobium marinisediminis]|uniref:mannitol dehydrogenase family protein n=1 Tax=Thalassorhabdomicrobium marinisediminis TaxID=2170577 RepID=UPI002490F042|nr:mannitol dehydrogenase family protein [Thalassorhabdomicrobium marinisediminis]
MTRLSAQTLAAVAETAAPPQYDRAARRVGIVHLGLGAFHKAHQAFYTDAAMAAQGGDWKIIGVSMRNEEVAADFNEQDGLFTILEKGAEGTRAQIIGSIDHALCARTQPDQVLQALCDENVRVVTTTVTEKGYGIDRATGGVDPSNPVIAHDLAGDSAPVGAIGLIVTALERRRDRGIAPFTVLCCDNLPDNGAFLRAGLIDFARRHDPALGQWIADTVPCPSSMVDRITPAQTSETRALARALTGTEDALAIETEPFHQWVIEDTFPTGRPAWEAAGAIFTEDVAAYESMKLRLLNGSHSLIAYMGQLLGKTYVRDVMADPCLEVIVRRHLHQAAATLPALPGIDVPQYCDALIARFRNPSIAHETLQIASDGSEKLPQRIFAPASDALATDGPIDSFALVAGLWMWYCRGELPSGAALNDPRADRLRDAAHADTPEAILAGFDAIEGLIPSDVSASPRWRGAILGLLQELSDKPLARIIEATCEQAD